MRKKIYILTILTSFLIATSTLNISALETPKNSLTIKNNSANNAEWTVMIYMAADNNLGYYQHGETDIEKIRVATLNDESGKTNIIVLYDNYGNGNTKLYNISNGKIKNIDDNGLIIPDNNEVNMGDFQTLVNFGTWTIANYPANHYMFILWGHGLEYGWQNANWFFTACVDDTSKNSIRIADHELINALDSITNHGEIKFDVIGFDTSLNALLEVAYEIKDYASLMIAPQDNQFICKDLGNGKYEWEDYGFNYYSPILSLINNPSDYSNKEKIKGLCSKFVDSYPEDYYDGSTLSVIDVDNIGSLTSAMDNLGEYLNEKIFVDKNPENIRRLENVLSNVIRYSYDYPEKMCSFYGDLYDFAEKIINYFDFDEDIKILAEQIKQSINDVVLDDNDPSDESHGISAYVVDPNCNGPTGTYTNLAFYTDTQFGQFIYDFKHKWSNNQAPNDIDVDGPYDIYANTEYTFTVKGIDPDGDLVYFEINWIDLQENQIYGPYQSGEKVKINHTWSKDACKEKEGSRQLRFEVHDYWNPIHQEWTFHDVNIHKPKSKQFINDLFNKCPLILHLLSLFQKHFVFQNMNVG